MDIGTHVKEGDVLAEIETPEVDQQLNQARANLKNAQANLQIAQITADRSENLFKSKTISSQERDLAKSDLLGQGRRWSLPTRRTSSASSTCRPSRKSTRPSTA